MIKDLLYRNSLKKWFKIMSAADLTIVNCSDDLRRMFNMSYAELVDHLFQKYGASQYDYFCKENCKSPQPKAKRTKEGLFIHHIDEDKGILLSNPLTAIDYPWEYQKADRLVYCDYLEHLLLHLKIWLERERNISQVGIGGAHMISEDLNEFYERNQFSDNWRKDVQEKIADRYDDYIIILKWFFKKLIDEKDRLSDIGKAVIMYDFFHGGVTLFERNGFKRAYAGKVFKSMTGKELKRRMIH